MKVIQTAIADVLLIEPEAHGDERGMLWESFNQRRFYQLSGIHAHFVQDNHSKSHRGVLRGLHYQICHPQAKLVRVIAGEVFDVAVDLRKTSPTFGCWTAAVLSAENRRQMWIPAGFAHGFLVTSESADFLYKVTDYYTPVCERAILWNDPVLDINWPLEAPPILSDKDKKAKLFLNAEVFP